MPMRAFRGTDEGIFKFRITPFGSTVNARYATIDQCVFHEAMLFTLPYWFGFVPCPFAGSTSLDYLEQTATITIPDYGVSDPEFVLTPRSVAGRNCFPRPASYGTGNSQTGYASEAWGIRIAGVTTTSLTLRFIKPALSTQSPLGCHVALAKRG